MLAVKKFYKVFFARTDKFKFDFAKVFIN